jgi:hypothetical protein
MEGWRHVAALWALADVILTESNADSKGLEPTSLGESSPQGTRTHKPAESNPGDSNPQAWENRAQGTRTHKPGRIEPRGLEPTSLGESSLGDSNPQALGNRTRKRS